VSGRLLVLALAVAGTGCAYYNGLYNANRLAREATRAEREGRTGEARSLWSQAAVKAESVASRHRKSKYWDDALLLRGRALARTGSCNQAVEPLTVAADSSTDTRLGIEARLLRGECHLQLREPESTLVAVGPVLTLGEAAEQSRAHLLRGQALLRLGRDAEALEGLADTYDQAAPDPEAAIRLRGLAESGSDLVGYFGKLIPQKGVDLLLTGAARAERRPATLVVGFGRHREWLTALALALREGDVEGLRWLTEAGGLTQEAVGSPAGKADVVFTGRLDHRYAPGALAAMDVLVVPSVLDEAFGMVAAEGAAAGALPLVARHSGLAEVAAALEASIGRPGALSFEPGSDAVRGIAEGVDRLLSLPAPERSEMREAIRACVVAEWSWRRTAERLLEAAGA